MYKKPPELLDLVCNERFAGWLGTAQCQVLYEHILIIKEKRSVCSWRTEMWGPRLFLAAGHGQKQWVQTKTGCIWVGAPECSELEPESFKHLILAPACSHVTQTKNVRGKQ